MIDFITNSMVYGRSYYNRTDFSKGRSQNSYTSFTSNQETNNNDNHYEIGLIDAAIGIGTLLVGGAVYLFSKGKKGRSFLNKVGELLGSNVKHVEPKVEPKQVSNIIEEIPDDIVEELVDGKWLPYYRKK